MRRARAESKPGRQSIPGIGPTLGAVLVAEIGDITRFASASKLTCWAGLTPKHHESDTDVRRGRITKQGSRLVRWAAIESIKTVSKTSEVGVLRERVGDRAPTREEPKAVLMLPSADVPGRARDRRAARWLTFHLAGTQPLFSGPPSLR
jgi:hypothetical protein